MILPRYGRHLAVTAASLTRGRIGFDSPESRMSERVRTGVRFPSPPRSQPSGGTVYDWMMKPRWSAIELIGVLVGYELTKWLIG